MEGHPLKSDTQRTACAFCGLIRVSDSRQARIRRGDEPPRCFSCAGKQYWAPRRKGSFNLQIRIDNHTADILELLAIERGLTRVALVREILDDYLAETPTKAGAT